jgi:hypothetical protein
MKKKLFFTSVLIAFFFFALNAQTVVDFESLTVPSEGYYNGSSDYSGSGNTETFQYSENEANFYVSYTNTGSYDYWNAFAYSNQTDLETADWTNYSAYANPAGGANASSNYVFAYVYFADSVMFDHTIHIDSVKIANSVWAYKYMTGEDGSGHAYQNGDFLILSINGINPDGSHNTEDAAYIYLGDGTNIVNNWTNVDLSVLGNVKGLIFTLTSSDSYTPFYFCMDNLSYSDAASIQSDALQVFSIYPNPVKNDINIINIQNSNIIISDLSGRMLFSKKGCNNSENINISNFKTGIYFVNIQNENGSFTKKFIKQ